VDIAVGARLLRALAAAQQPKLLEPERAFAFSVQAVDENTVEARFAIANGYYLYREKLKFSVEPVALAAAPVLPPGKMKHDEFFGTSKPIGVPWRYACRFRARREDRSPSRRSRKGVPTPACAIRPSCKR
jgi:thiol:disulfide interchange protein